MSFENLTKSQCYKDFIDGTVSCLHLEKLRASFHRDVQVICKEMFHKHSLKMTKPAMEIIAELVYKKICFYALDLEAFAKHAKRSTINSDDVLLLVRRNPSLKANLTALINNQPSTSKVKKRKTNSMDNVKETPKAMKITPAIESEKLDKEKVNKEKKDKEKEVASDFNSDHRTTYTSLSTIDLTFD